MRQVNKQLLKVTPLHNLICLLSWFKCLNPKFDHKDHAKFVVTLARTKRTSPEFKNF